MPRRLVKPWFTSFVECTLPHTEAPKNYLLWSAFSVLGGILKNHVYYKDGLYTVYPNQYIILTGPPSIGKGTAINYAWSLVKDATATYPLSNTISDRVTAPRILQRIAEGWALPPQIATSGQVVTSLREHTCTLFSTELRVLVTASDWMLEFLCESWDRNTYDYDTKNMGSSIIKNMCTSLIGGTVPDYIRGMEKDVDASIAGGFSSRCLFIFEDKKSKELPFAQPIEDNPKSFDLYQKLKEDLIYIASNLRGEYTLNADAKLAFANFYPSISPQPDDSDAMLNFKGRMKAHIIKAAMVLCASKKDDLIITGQEMKDAIFLINTIRKQLDRVFRGMGSSRLADATARVQLCIEKYSMVTRRELLRTLHRHVTQDDLDRVLHLLETIGHVRLIKQGQTVYYAPPLTKIPNPTGGIVKP
jgi:hypothetical protein